MGSEEKSGRSDGGRRFAPPRGRRVPTVPRRGESSATASPIVAACAVRREKRAQKTRAQVSASGSARWVSSTSMPSASASEASPRRFCSGANRRAIATVQSTGGCGQSSPARENAPRSTPRSNRAECATSTRPRSSRASSGSTASGGGASSSIACVMPVKRWIPRPSGIDTPTSELQRSCSSPPPTSTAPTSVSSQRSRASPFVSVSTARNSAEASGWERRFSAASSMGVGGRPP